MNRRQFLAAGAALAVSPALPAADVVRDESYIDCGLVEKLAESLERDIYDWLLERGYRVRPQFAAQLAASMRETKERVAADVFSMRFA